MTSRRCRGRMCATPISAGSCRPTRQARRTRSARKSRSIMAMTPLSFVRSRVALVRYAKTVLMYAGTPEKTTWTATVAFERVSYQSRAFSPFCVAPAAWLVAGHRLLGSKSRKRESSIPCPLHALRTRQCRLRLDSARRDHGHRVFHRSSGWSMSRQATAPTSRRSPRGTTCSSSRWRCSRRSLSSC